ncbi:hypothetical protein [Pseudomonas sp. KU43P]|uniref:hypothetical protein n=1 Tax=Pseudomonas sp. KU43P TaxID=2487887 RepID=UPI0029531580|nr:hypothetical protein [Pseudomonas sp. KU43P]
MERAYSTDMAPIKPLDQKIDKHPHPLQQLPARADEHRMQDIFLTAFKILQQRHPSPGIDIRPHMEIRQARNPRATEGQLWKNNHGVPID